MAVTMRLATSMVSKTSSRPVSSGAAPSSRRQAKRGMAFRCKAEEEEKETEAVAQVMDPETAIATRQETGTDLWFATDQSLSYLNGNLAGDYGFDPLGVSDPEGAGSFVSPEWLAYSELIHARFAMIAIAGVAAPEVLGRAGVIPAETALPWFQSGVIGPTSVGFEYWADPYSLFLGQVVMIGFAEFRRWGDYNNPGSMSKQDFMGMEKMFEGSGDPKYPGGPFFNLWNYGKDEKELKVLKNKEIKNGRLAMMGMLGVYVQAANTGVGPVQNLIDHISNPFGANIFTNF